MTPVLLGLLGYPCFAGPFRALLAIAVPSFGIAVWFAVFKIRHYFFAGPEGVVSGFVAAAIYHTIVVTLVTLVWVGVFKLISDSDAQVDSKS